MGMKRPGKGIAGSGSSTPTLQALTGTFTLAEDAAPGTVAGAIGGRTTGSTLSLFDAAGDRVALSGLNIVSGATGLDYETGTDHAFTVRETLAGATNTPRDTVLSLTVTDVAEGGGAPDAGLLDFSAGEQSGLLVVLEDF